MDRRGLGMGDVVQLFRKTVISPEGLAWTSTPRPTRTSGWPWCWCRCFGGRCMPDGHVCGCSSAPPGAQVIRASAMGGVVLFLPCCLMTSQTWTIQTLGVWLGSHMGLTLLGWFWTPRWWDTCSLARGHHHDFGGEEEDNAIPSRTAGDARTCGLEVWPAWRGGVGGTSASWDVGWAARFGPGRDHHHGVQARGHVGVGCGVGRKGRGVACGPGALDYMAVRCVRPICLGFRSSTWARVWGQA